MNLKEKKAKEYQDMVKAHEPRTNLLKNCIFAFVVGGIICDIGQAFLNLYSMYFPKDEAQTLTSITMIFLGAFLTGIGVYDKIGRFAGAGSIVPITGFSNSIVSPAVEYKKEGFVFGVGSKMFLIAEPVLVCRISTSILIGFVCYFVKIFPKI
ncbi:stage V sporulation protein AC [Caldicellulosiruptor naganoensis]|uniref:Stage V sporulation protein AC n=1 Tax=Caldicellulosiruptor naganoensis TaxID=29324 RepID=A0ABY7BJT9_9FIRM|nr:stage V sporulation protein AC [Caldicellulosiruptor naganoensis]WAM31614.1 stage V sporulation protein AC [Caldicellulosiruptor naganoensis]